MRDKLPSEYQELEYIRSNGGPYIDTQVNGNNVNLKIVTKYETLSASQGCIFSARYDAKKRNIFLE